MSTIPLKLFVSHNLRTGQIRILPDEEWRESQISAIEKAESDKVVPPEGFTGKIEDLEIKKAKEIEEWKNFLESTWGKIESLRKKSVDYDEVASNADFWKPSADRDRAIVGYYFDVKTVSYARRTEADGKAKRIDTETAKVSYDPNVALDYLTSTGVANKTSTELNAIHPGVIDHLRSFISRMFTIDQGVLDF